MLLQTGSRAIGDLRIVFLKMPMKFLRTAEHTEVSKIGAASSREASNGSIVAGKWRRSPALSRLDGRECLVPPARAYLDDSCPGSLFVSRTLRSRSFDAWEMLCDLKDKLVMREVCCIRLASCGREGQSVHLVTPWTSVSAVPVSCSREE